LPKSKINEAATKHNMVKAKPKDFGDEGENINISDEELVS
jgi:hypothetical protein